MFTSKASYVRKQRENKVLRSLRTTLFAAVLIAPVLDPSAFAAEFNLISADGATEESRLYVSGPIQVGDYDQFRAITGNTPNVTVTLNSPGGSVREGLAIGAEIAIRGYRTYVTSGAECYSICAIIWIGGAMRMMDKDAIIGVHAAYREVARDDGTSSAEEVGSANAEIGFYLRELNLSREAVLYFTTAGPTEALPITPQIARRLDLDPFVYDGLRWQRPEDYPSPRRIVKHVAEYVNLAAGCAELFSVGQDWLKAQGKRVLTEGNEKYSAEVIVDLIPEFTRMVGAEEAEFGLVRWCIKTELEFRKKGMPTGITGPGFDCRKAGTATERTICGNTSLWTLDRAMGRIYFILRAHDPSINRAAFLADQREWLSRRDQCGGDADCIMERYTSRLYDFER